MKLSAFPVLSSARRLSLCWPCPAEAALQAQQGALLAQQAQGRQEHRTTMFLSKGCKLGDMQR